MKLKHIRLFGGRGIRSFSLWLTLWGAICWAIWLAIPFDPYANLPSFLFFFQMAVFINPLFWAADTLCRGAVDIWTLPQLYLCFCYLLGRFLDWLFLKPTNP